MGIDVGIVVSKKCLCFFFRILASHHGRSGLFSFKSITLIKATRTVERFLLSFEHHPVHLSEVLRLLLLPHLLFFCLRQVLANLGVPTSVPVIMGIY